MSARRFFDTVTFTSVSEGEFEVEHPNNNEHRVTKKNRLKVDTTLRVMTLNTRSSLIVFHHRVPSVHIVIGVLFGQVFIAFMPVTMVMMVMFLLGGFCIGQAKLLNHVRMLRRFIIGIVLGTLPIIATPTVSSFNMDRMTLLVVSPVTSLVADQINFVGKLISDSTVWWQPPIYVQVRSVVLPWRNSELITEGVVVHVKGRFRPTPPTRWGSHGYMKRKKIDAQGVADFISAPIAIGKDWRGEMRNSLRTPVQHARSLFPTGAALLASMLLGDRSDIAPWIEQLFKETTLTHVLVISGMQVTLLFLVVYTVIKVIASGIRVLRGIISAPIRNEAIETVALFVVMLYVYILGMDDAAVRALYGLTLAIGARWCGYRTSVLQVTMAMAVVSLLLTPMCFFDLSFQLTCGALIGIVFGMYAAGHIQRSSWRSSLYATMGATSITSLICFQHFGTIAPWGILYNVVFAWPLSLISCTLGMPALLVDTFIDMTYCSLFIAAALEYATILLEWLRSVLPFSSSVTLGLFIHCSVITFLLHQTSRRLRRECGRNEKSFVVRSNALSV